MKSVPNMDPFHFYQEKLNKNMNFVPSIMQQSLPINSSPSILQSEKYIIQDDESNSQGSTLFVGDLSRIVSREDILELFSNYGEVKEVRLKHAKVTKHPLGYGFVEMKDPMSASACVQNLNGHILKGKQISVRWASRNKKLFFANLGKTTTLNDILTLCQNYGSICPESSSIHTSESGNVYAVVEFDERESAEAAKVALNGAVVKFHGQDITIFVNWEQSVSNRTKQLQSSSSHATFPYFSVHISFRSNKGNIRVTEKMIYQAYKSYGNMTTVTIKNIFIDPNTGTQSGFGFIHFETLDGARNAVNHGSNLQIGGVSYTAEFSKHLTKRGEKKDDESFSSQAVTSTPPPLPPTWVPPQHPHYETMSYSTVSIPVYPHGFPCYPPPGSFSASYQIPYSHLQWQESYGYSDPYQTYYHSI